MKNHDSHDGVDAEAADEYISRKGPVFTISELKSFGMMLLTAAGLYYALDKRIDSASRDRWTGAMMEQYIHRTEALNGWTWKAADVREIQHQVKPE